MKLGQNQEITVILTCFMVYFGRKMHVPENDELFLKNGIPVPDFASVRLATLPYNHQIPMSVI